MPAAQSAEPGYEELLKQVDNLKKVDRQRLFRDLIPKLDKDLRGKLARCSWEKEDKQNLGLCIEVPICLQDPTVGRDKLKQPSQSIEVAWDPELIDGPTSARLAVVDIYEDQPGKKTPQPPAQWDEKQWCFVDQQRKPIIYKLSSYQFHQVNVWAIVQRVLEFYEHPEVLGRPVPWAFNGNRLILKPHAKETCYDRQTKSLKFHYVPDKSGVKRVFTCLSHDIVAHETGHAVLDGIRPYFLSSYTLQTEALHEFVADLTAILSALRNNDIRKIFTDYFTKGASEANFLAEIAEEFGQAVTDREYLRTGLNDCSMDDVTQLEEARPADAAHTSSQVLTGLIFDILLRLLESYWRQRPGKKGKQDEKPGNAAWQATQRLTRLALQPLDYLPPVDATFSDYVEALLRRDKLLYPVDEHDYRGIIRELCRKRKIPAPPENQPPKTPKNLDRPSVNGLLASSTSAYNYIHTNRQSLHIPAQRDVFVEVYAADRVSRANYHLPRDIIVQYHWEEKVDYPGSVSGLQKDLEIPLLCGGTLAFDENANLQYWVTKPGTEFVFPITPRTSDRTKEEWLADEIRGKQRRQELLDYAKRMVAEKTNSEEFLNNSDDYLNNPEILFRFLGIPTLG